MCVQVYRGQPEDDAGVPGARVLGGYELPNLGAIGTKLAPSEKPSSALQC